MERKFTRGLNKPGMAAQLRESVSQVVRESAVLVSCFLLVFAVVIAFVFAFVFLRVLFTIFYLCCFHVVGVSRCMSAFIIVVCSK